MASGGNTRKSPSVAVDKAGSQSRHGARLANRGRSRGRRENHSNKSLGVRGEDGGHEASGVAHESPRLGDEEGGGKTSGVAENPQGSQQGVGGGVESSQGTDIPGVAEFPRGDKNPGVTTVGEREPREEGRGQGGDGNPPTTRSTGSKGAGGSDNERMGGTRTAPPPRPQRGTAVDDSSAGIPTRNTNSTDGARPEYGALARREYGLLAPTRTAVNLADAWGPRECGQT